LEIINEQAYFLDVPAHNEIDVSRTLTTILVLPPHEVIRREIDEHPGLSDELRDAVLGDHFAPSYYANSVVAHEPQGKVYPLELYLDGVPTTKQDGLLAFHLVNIISGRRHRCAVVRKSRWCQCGCRGWCSLVTLWTCGQWSLSLLARGALATHRHSGEPWRPSDSDRASPREDASSVVACLLHLKADGHEIALSIGFPACADKGNPCFACQYIHESWKICMGVSATSFPFAEMDQ